MRTRTWIVFTMLAGCSTQKAAPPQAPPEPPPNPCAGVLSKTTVDPMVVCGPVGERNVTIDIVDEAGASMGTVKAGAEVKLVRTPGIRRDPGHVDEQVCIASGERAGTVGYIQNTRFFARSCN